MKNSKNNFTLLVITIGLAYGCGMSQKSIEVLHPASITLPDQVQTIAIVNRSRPKSKTANIIEGILSNEDPWADRSGAKRAIEGLNKTMQETPRYSVKQTGIEMKGSGGDLFPPPLSWRFVDSICKAFNSQAVASLEQYDTDTRMDHRRNEIKSKDKEGKEITTIEFESIRTTSVKLGWRLYDNESKTIRDEYPMVHENQYSGKGISEEQSMASLPSKASSNDATSYDAGVNYGWRIAPCWTVVVRQYYKKGNDQMELANRKSNAGDWDGAVEIWKKIVYGNNKKLAGRAAYNIALACEVQGKLDIAREWASKSYTQFENKKARSYIYIIDGRIADQKRVTEQMRGVGN